MRGMRGHVLRAWRCMRAGGRVTGTEVISELIFELDASVEAAQGFEGEMQRLAGYARCVLRTLLLCPG